MNITIEKKAEVMLKNKLDVDQFVRVGVTEGGCAGLTYSAEIADEMRDNESVIHTEGEIRVVADEESMKYLDGLVIDYSDDLINGGLQFKNSNTQTTCGCGQSFGLVGMPKIEGGSCNK